MSINARKTEKGLPIFGSHFLTNPLESINCNEETINQCRLIKYLVFDRYLSKLLNNKLYLKKRLREPNNSAPDRFIINLIRYKNLLDFKQIESLFENNLSNKEQSVDSVHEINKLTDSLNMNLNALNSAKIITNLRNELYYGALENENDIGSIDSCDVDELISTESEDTNIHNEISLRIQSKVQTEIIRQANLVLKLSKKEKSSVYEIETERILLLASLKRDALIQEIENLSDDIDSLFRNISSIRIYDINLKTAAKYLITNPNINYNFLIVATHKTTVLGTKLLQLDDQLHESIDIANSFEFQRVPFEFEINIQIFYVKEIVNNDPNENRRCLPIGKLFRKEQEIPNKFSFKTCYQTYIRKDNLCKHKKMYFSVDEQIEIQFQFNIEFSMRKCGFLTTSFNKLQDWNRYWSVLKNHQLHFWFYPNDENLKPAFKIINLAEFQKIEIANRNSCPRSYSLVLKKHNYEVFLKTDNVGQLKYWFDILCYALSIAKNL